MDVDRLHYQKEKHRSSSFWPLTAGLMSLTRLDLSGGKIRGYYLNEVQKPSSPGASVENVKVSIADGGAKGLVWQIGWSSCQGCQSPLKVTRRRTVSPAARVPVKGALSCHLTGIRWHSCDFLYKKDMNVECCELKQQCLNFNWQLFYRFLHFNVQTDLLPPSKGQKAKAKGLTVSTSSYM